MTRTSPPQVAFSSGEIDPLLHRRIDYQRYQTGLARCRGFMPMPQGGFTRAPGTIHRGEVPSNTVVLVPFVFAQDDAMVLEFTWGQIRFWRYGELVMAGSVPYTVATPYDPAALENLQWVQSADVIYLADGSRPIHRLARLGLNNWTLAQLDLFTGPFRVQNLAEAETLQANAQTGSITLTASSPRFDANSVGVLFQLTPRDNTAVALWTGNDAIDVGEFRRYGGNTYQLLSGINSGANPPIHTEGDWRTDKTVVWRFIDDGTGVVRITSVTSPTVAQATVLKTIPTPCVIGPTYRWSEGAWNNRFGYPRSLQIYDQRLCAAATPFEPRSVWFSAVGDFSDFKPGTEVDQSFSYTISGDDTANRILNLKRGRSGLHVLALGEEYSTRSENRAQVIGPTTAVFGQDSSIGSSPARPISVDGAPIFVSRDKRAVMQIQYSLQDDQNIARNLSIAAQHFGANGFEQIVWQGRPQKTMWLRDGVGDLFAVLMDAQEDILGWTKLPIVGGIVRGMVVIPSPDGRQDILSLAIRRIRNVDGVPTEYVAFEELALTADMLIGAAPIRDACHLFAALRYSGAPQATFSAPHLAGKEVHAWTDLGNMGPLTASADGTVILPSPVSSAFIGLFDETHEAVTLDILAQSPEGNTFGHQKRMQSGLGLGLHITAQGKLQIIERDFGQADRVGQAQLVVPRAVASSLTDAFSGIAKVSAPSGQAKELAVRITPVGGAPLTVTSITSIVEEAGR